MAGCPDIPAGERQGGQQVMLTAGRWEGATCPGALLADPWVRVCLETYWPLEHWHQLPWPGGWGEQAAWWTDAMLLAKQTYEAIEREKVPTNP